MKKVAISTDSNSGITQEEASKLGVFVIPMPFTINGKDYFEDINLTQDQFYDFLASDADVSTSQPSVAAVQDLWDDILKEYDEIVYIPMSSGLSGSCDTAQMLSQDYDGRVEVVDNQRISVTQKQSVIDAKKLADKGFSAKEIKEILLRDKMKSGIYIMVDTMKYLKKGGRVTPAAAVVATVLGIKPVLQIQGGKLDAFAKVRGVRQAHKVMLDALKKDMETRVIPENAEIAVAHTKNPEEAEKIKEEILSLYPGREVIVDALSLSVSCHIGPGSLALAWSEKTPELK
ncbi:MAG: DegV family protein [Lachnospiraceae bacterium]|nr:DegV family protein [Lachnospiraceae bacterium]